jgi:glycosyltransferase involved in cell wall biosynthesis
VRFCPEKIPSEPADIQDGVLREIIQSRRKYFLMVSANRRPKNPYKLVMAFERFCQFNNEIDLVVVNFPRKGSERVHVLPFLSDGDLAHALRNCYALVYPSFFEGFGYPPLEAMKYGKPVLASNVTSMPEILGDAPIYFSPFYNADMFKAMITLAEMSEEEYSKRSEISLEQYKVVQERQELDLQSLIDIILEP